MAEMRAQVAAWTAADFHPAKLAACAAAAQTVRCRCRCSMLQSDSRPPQRFASCVRRALSAEAHAGGW